MIIEICYTYRPDKSSPAQQSWTYFYVKSDELTAKVKERAKSHFKKWCAGLGWTNKAKLTKIAKIRNVEFVQRNRAGVRKSKATTAPKERKVRGQRTQPSKDNEQRKSSRANTGENRRQTKQSKARSRPVGK